jgi:3-oxoacyl-[acyl-carrier protein] reductase
MAPTGRTAIVTGGSRGIGRAVVERLVSEGIAVVFSYADDDRSAEATLDRVRGLGGTAYAHRCDLRRLADIGALFDEAQARFGTVDIVVHNAGVAAKIDLLDVTEEAYDRAMAINAKGAFFTIQQAGRRMADGGRIVTISSAFTRLAATGWSVYVGAKGAIEQFTRVAALELAARGITANSLSPGFTDTDMLRTANSTEVLDYVVTRTALGRLGRPEDIAATVAFLVSPDSGWITGQNIAVTGGFN